MQSKRRQKNSPKSCAFLIVMFTSAKFEKREFDNYLNWLYFENSSLRLNKQICSGVDFTQTHLKKQGETSWVESHEC